MTSQITIRKQLALVVGLFVCIILALLFVAYMAMDTLSTVRAYVAGEGLYSKAQKDAAYHLMRYALSRDEAEYAESLQALSAPEGDREARLELERPSASLDKADRAFLLGRNHPDDVHGLSLLFRRARHVSYIDKAIRIWAEGDERIREQRQMAEELHARIQNGATPDALKPLLRQIDANNARLAVLEDDFSSTLGEAARWLEGLLVRVMVLLTLAFLALGVSIGAVISRQVVRGVRDLRDGTDRVARGDFGRRIEIRSRNELAELAVEFNRMTDSLVEARQERNQAEEALQRRARELSDANEKLVEHEKIKSAFFANVSHELRTPLSLILAPLESLLSGPAPLPPHAEALLGTMHNNAVRLLQMMNGLLDFQKLEARKVEVSRVPTDVAALTRTLFADFEPMLRKRGIQARIAGTLEAAPIQMDRYLYERIFFNLMSNAAKFTPAGGTIEVALALQQESLSLSVADTGIGISAEDQKGLFQRFRQVDGASTRRFEGTGLGLALVKEFSELLGGAVRVESELRRGSTFTVTLPAPPAELAGHAEQDAHSLPLERELVSLPAPSAAPPPNSEESVLIVEDNAELAAYLSSVISQLCPTRHAPDGEAALEMLGDFRPTLILSDVMMPRRDGLSLCREVKSREATRDIPLVLLTALTHREALLDGWKAGADDYLFKPFHPQEVLTRLRSLLATQRALREHRAQQKELEAKLVLAERLAALGTLAGGVGHEINNPLSYVISNLNMVQVDLDEWRPGFSEERLPELLEMVREARQGADRVKRIVLDMKTFARADSHENAPMDVHRALDLSIKMVAHQLRQRARVVTAYGDVPEVLAHEGRLGQVFVNLLVNAAQAIGGGHAEENEIRVSTGVQDGRVSVEIRDTGSGITEDVQRRIFEPFFTTKPVGEGTGLGLAICHGIVTRLGGQIEVESQVGSGTCMRVLLPVALARRENDAPERAPQAAEGVSGAAN